MYPDVQGRCWGMPGAGSSGEPEDAGGTEHTGARVFCPEETSAQPWSRTMKAKLLVSQKEQGLFILMQKSLDV